MKKRHYPDEEPDLNADPITGAPGAHPVGAGLGAAGGAAAGLAVGSIAGPVGSVVGAAVGGLAGGLAGKGIAEHFDPTLEDAHWREHHPKQPWADAQYTYDDDYEPAYRYGYTNRAREGVGTWEESESDLESGWEDFKGNSRLTWEQARDATRAGWHRVERALPGDFDRDGR